MLIRGRRDHNGESRATSWAPTSSPVRQSMYVADTVLAQAAVAGDAGGPFAGLGVGFHGVHRSAGRLVAECTGLLQFSQETFAVAFRLPDPCAFIMGATVLWALCQELVPQGDGLVPLPAHGVH